MIRTLIRTPGAAALAVGLALSVAHAQPGSAAKDDTGRSDARAPTPGGAAGADGASPRSTTPMGSGPAGTLGGGTAGTPGSDRPSSTVGSANDPSQPRGASSPSSSGPGGISGMSTTGAGDGGTVQQGRSDGSRARPVTGDERSKVEDGSVRDVPRKPTAPDPENRSGRRWE